MRLHDWEARLAEFLGGQRDALFAWGALDCALFAADAVKAMTGDDPAWAYRGRYTTRIGSLRVLHAEGHRSLADAVDAHFGRVATGMARRGDLVMAGGSLGVCGGRQAWFVGLEGQRRGLVGLPIDHWEHAWRVPFAEG